MSAVSAGARSRSIGRQSAQDAHHAAGAMRAAQRRPSPPRQSGSCATSLAVCPAASWSAGVPRRSVTAAAMCSSWAVANSSVSSGAIVRR
eukprot:8386792-Pyramimonas_sp.AAC.1